MWRLRSSVGSAVGATALGLLFASAAAAQPLTLEQLIETAMERNPTLHIVQARLEAAEADTAQSLMWPNLHLSYATETVNGHESHGLYMRQLLPTSARRQASADVHARDADLAKVLVDEQQLRVANSVHLLYRSALIAVPRIALQEEVIAHLEETLETIKQLVNVGLEDRTDVLETEMELRHARLDLNEERLEQRHVWTELASMIGDPSLTIGPLAGDPMELPPALDHDDLLAIVLKESPEMKAAQAEVARDSAAVTFERRETRPDLGLTYARRYNEGLVGFGHESEVPSSWENFFDLDLAIPLWNRNQFGVEAAQADVRMAEAGVDLEMLKLRAKFDDLFHEYEIERTEAQVFRDEILPRAEEVHELTLARYEDFGEDYTEVLEARGAILSTRGTILESLADSWSHAILIEGLMLADGLMEPKLHLLENAAIGSAETGYR